MSVADIVAPIIAKYPPNANRQRNGAPWGMSLAPWREWVDPEEPVERNSNGLWNRVDYRPYGGQL